MVWSDSGVDALELDERPHEKPGADEQHDAERDLHDDERGPCAMVHAAETRLPVAPERVRDIGAQNLRERREREQQAPDERRTRREREHVADRC